MSLEHLPHVVAAAVYSAGVALPLADSRRASGVCSTSRIDPKARKDPNWTNVRVKGVVVLLLQIVSLYIFSLILDDIYN